VCQAVCGVLIVTGHRGGCIDSIFLNSTEDVMPESLERVTHAQIAAGHDCVAATDSTTEACRGRDDGVSCASHPAFQPGETLLKGHLQQCLIERHISLRQLTVEVRRDYVELRGQVKRYYYKQLAQEAVKPLLGDRVLHNRIAVVPDRSD
jgi:hypothetical protein